MDKNKKFFIIAGILLVFLVIFLGVNEYQKQQKTSQEEISEEEQSFLLKSNHPESSSDLKNFVYLMLYSLTGITDDNCQAVICEIHEYPKNCVGVGCQNKNALSCIDINYDFSLKEGGYMGTTLKLKNLLDKTKSDYSLTSNYDLCFVFEPVFGDSLLADSYENQSLYFPEGNIVCTGNSFKITDNTKPFWYGFIPQGDYLKARVYLINHDENEGAIDELFSSQSFKELNEILEKHSLILKWQKTIMKAK